MRRKFGFGMFREKKELFLESNGLEIVYWEKFRKNNRVNESRTGNRGYIINRSIVNIIFPRGIFLLDGGKKKCKNYFNRSYTVYLHTICKNYPQEVYNLTEEFLEKKLRQRYIYLSLSLSGREHFNHLETSIIKLLLVFDDINVPAFERS